MFDDYIGGNARIRFKFKWDQSVLVACSNRVNRILQLGLLSLFVFLIGSREQNGVSLLTPVSDSVFIALSDGTFLFSLHGSFKNHQHKAL